MIEDWRKLNKVVWVNANTPVFIAFYFNEMPSFIIINDWIKQIGIDLTKIALSFELIFIYKK